VVSDFLGLTKDRESGDILSGVKDLLSQIMYLLHLMRVNCFNDHGYKWNKISEDYGDL
jgi:hypothetical protein